MPTHHMSLQTGVLKKAQLLLAESLHQWRFHTLVLPVFSALKMYKYMALLGCGLGGVGCLHVRQGVLQLGHLLLCCRSLVLGPVQALLKAQDLYCLMLHVLFAKIQLIQLHLVGLSLHTHIKDVSLELEEVGPVMLHPVPPILGVPRLLPTPKLLFSDQKRQFKWQDAMWPGLTLPGLRC